MEMKKQSNTKIVLIGGSAGSLKVVLAVLPYLKVDLPFPIVFVLHRKSFPDSTLSSLFSHYTKLPVYDIEDKMSLRKGACYIVPPDYHVLFEDRELLSLDSSEKMNYSRPSIDVVFGSASQVFGPHVVALLLSGANADGVEGLKCVTQQGGVVLVQRPDTSEVEYMPSMAIANVQVDHILAPAEMANFINHLDV